MSGRLTVGASGSIKATAITAKSAIIAGEVRGDVNAPELVKLEATARLYGNITTSMLIIEQGALFVGYSRMNEKQQEEVIE